MNPAGAKRLARYSPDFTFKQLLAKKQIALHDQTQIRRLVLDEGQILTEQAMAGELLVWELLVWVLC